MVLVPAVIGLALFAAAGALFTSAVKNADGEHGSGAVTGIMAVVGGCVTVMGCGFLIVSLGVVYCAGVAPPLH